MPHTLRFFTGDDAGRIKAISCTPGSGKDVEISETALKLDHAARSVQKLAVAPRDSQLLARASPLASRLVLNESGVQLACARDGSLAVYSVGDGLNIRVVFEATRPGRCIGLQIVEPRGVFSCYSSGEFHLAPLNASEDDGLHASLPQGLKDLRLGPNASTFACGGGETDVSLWDVEKTFAAHNAGPSSKRKKAELQEGELWRAKNVPNDNIGLQVPVDVMTVACISSLEAHHLMSGTGFGSVRRYDTRAARRPVADWKKIVKSGAVRRIEQSQTEHCVFISDERGEVFALDTRNGRNLYTYKAIGGTVTSTALCAASPHLASTSMDRFFRLHSTVSPPQKAGTNQEERGEVLGKLFMDSIPTAVAWDPTRENPSTEPEEEQEDDEAIWRRMGQAGDSDSDDAASAPRKKTRV